MLVETRRLILGESLRFLANLKFSDARRKMRRKKVTLSKKLGNDIWASPKKIFTIIWAAALTEKVFYFEI